MKRGGPGEESWKCEGEEDVMGWRRKDVSTAVLRDWRAAVGGGGVPMESVRLT